METLTPSSRPVNSMPPESDLATRLKRDIGMHRAAQLLSDAMRCRAGLSPLPLVQADRHDREWFRQTARQLIEIFETVTGERDPDAVREERERATQRAEWTSANNVQSARMRGNATAGKRGHTLGPWQPSGVESETAVCVNCGRSATINLSPETWFRRESLAGSAIASGCLMPVPEPAA